MSMRLSHIGVHDIPALFSITSLRVYDKEKREQVKVIIFYNSEMDSNTFLFESTVPIIGHNSSWTGSICIDVHTKW